MSDPHPLRISVDGDTLRIEWNNRRVPKDNFVFGALLLFWILWCPTTLFVTWLAFQRLEAFFFIWLIFGWIGTLGIPYTFLGRSWFEAIVVGRETVAHELRGVCAPRPKVVSIGPKVELLLGFYDEESNLTLSLLGPKIGLTKRHTLAYWLSPKLKREVFDAIERFVRAAGIELATRRTTGDH